MNHLRQFAYECLHDPFDKKSRVTNGFVSFLIIFSLSVIPLEFLPPEYEWVEPHLMTLEKFVVTIFLAEYLLRVWSSKNPLSFIFSWGGLIDLVAILPFFLERFEVLESVGIFLVLRLVRVFKFINIFNREQSALSHAKDRKQYNELYTIEGEEIERIIFKHPIIFLLNLFFPIVLTGTSLFLFIAFYGSVLGYIVAAITFFSALVFFIKFWLDFNFDTLFITNYRVVVQDHHLFGATINALRYESINNIVPDNRGLFQWIFQIGVLEIQTASDLANLFFRNVKDPHRVAQEIEENRQRFVDMDEK